MFMSAPRSSDMFAISTLLVAVALLTLPAPNAFGDSLTLREALSEVDQSPRVERAQSAAEELSWKRAEGLSGFLPTVTASGERLFSKRFALLDVTLGGSPAPISIPQVIPTTTYSLGFTWPLFDGLGAFDRFDSAKAIERAGQKELEWSRFQTQREIILQFYRALAAQILNDVANQNLKTLEDHLGDTRLFKKSGVSTNYDVLRVEVQTSEARSELLNSTDDIKVAELRLGELLGRDSENRKLDGQLPVLDAKLIEKLDAGKVQERADLLALRERTSAYGLLQRSSSKWWVPKVFLQGNYQSYDNRGDKYWDEAEFREAYALALEVRWTLFDGFASYARNREATEQKYQAERTTRIAEVKAKNDLEFWRRKFVYYCSVYRSRVENISRSTESARLAREGRKVGVRTNTDLLDAETDLFRARAGTVNAQLGAVEALINLELASGVKLYDF
jgi:outer membrane protein TolC